MGLAILLADAAGAAAGVGPELIAFVAGTGGTIFGAGMVIGIAKKRLDDAEKAVAAAAEACKTATANAAKIAALEKDLDQLRVRVRGLKAIGDKLFEAMTDLVGWMTHANTRGEPVPEKVLNDISDILASPIHRKHQESI